MPHGGVPTGLKASIGRNASRHPSTGVKGLNAVNCDETYIYASPST